MTPSRSAGRKTYYEVYCGNHSCPSRRLATDGGGLFSVHRDDLPDGEVWFCPACRKRAA